MSLSAKTEMFMIAAFLLKKRLRLRVFMICRSTAMTVDTVIKMYTGHH